MKYIRTKDGIWKLDELGCVHHPYNNMPIHKSYLEVVSEADTIEELCDEFVYIRHDKPHYPPKVVRDLSTLRENRWCDVYGAIWTDKGLIYVAKMNEKGELELL